MPIVTKFYATMSSKSENFVPHFFVLFAAKLFIKTSPGVVLIRIRFNADGGIKYCPY